MKPFLIWSDLHIHSHKKSLDRLMDCLKVLRWVFDTAIERKIEHVIFLGDLFHDRTKAEIITLCYVYDIFEEYFWPKAPFSLWLLLGNHDLYHHERLDVYSPRMLGGFDGVTIIDKPGTRLIGGVPIDFLPYTHNPLEDLKKIADKNPKKAGEKRILCSHLAIDGAELNTFGTLADVIVEHDGEMVKVGADRFAHWDKVWLGHYHGSQTLEVNNVEYIGSPLQLTKSEANQVKHIALFDPTTLDCEYIENDFSPVHLILKPEDIKKHKLEGNFVTLRVPSNMPSTEVVELRTKILKDHKLGSFDVKPYKKEDSEQVVQDAKAILLDEKKMLETYVDQTRPSHLLRDVLLKAGDLICRMTNEQSK